MHRPPVDPVAPGAEDEPFTFSVVVPLPDVHPADCQSCSENCEPCRTHAQDYRYWQARALDVEAVLILLSYQA